MYDVQKKDSSDTYIDFVCKGECFSTIEISRYHIVSSRHQGSHGCEIWYIFTQIRIHGQVLFRQLMIDLPVSRKLLVDLLKSFGIPNAPIADSSCLHSSKTVRNILNVVGSRSEIDLSGI